MRSVCKHISYTCMTRFNKLTMTTQYWDFFWTFWMYCKWHFCKHSDDLIHELGGMATHKSPKQSQVQFKLSYAIRILFLKNKTGLLSAVATEAHISLKIAMIFHNRWNGRCHKDWQIRVRSLKTLCDFDYVAIPIRIETLMKNFETTKTYIAVFASCCHLSWW